MKAIMRSVGIGMGLILTPVTAKAGALPADYHEVDEKPGYIPPPEAEQLSDIWERQIVYFRSNEPVGTIIISTKERFLYLVQGNNRAMRFGIGVGRDGFQWKGLVKVIEKHECLIGGLHRR